ncbi:MAG TPA: hypothetical protein VJ725_11675 [Thermoanaerobaculia bacterium]|nr:hypothetical protein [Thermoanaerobaculia bacterium]
MKVDYLMWAVVLGLAGFVVTQAVRSALRRPRIVAGLGLVRQNLGLIAVGAFVGAAAYLPSHTSLTSSGMLGWVLSLVFATVSVPIYFVVDATFSLWGFWGQIGLWVVVALAACLYHGALAVWLGNVYRREPRRAVLIGSAILGVHFGVYVIWQALSVAQAAS